VAEQVPFQVKRRGRGCAQVALDSFGGFYRRKSVAQAVNLFKVTTPALLKYAERDYGDGVQIKNPRNCVDLIVFCEGHEIQRNLKRQQVLLDIKP